MCEREIVLLHGPCCHTHPAWKSRKVCAIQGLSGWGHRKSVVLMDPPFSLDLSPLSFGLHVLSGQYSKDVSSFSQTPDRHSLPRRGLMTSLTRPT